MTVLLLPSTTSPWLPKDNNSMSALFVIRLLDRTVTNLGTVLTKEAPLAIVTCTSVLPSAAVTGVSSGPPSGRQLTCAPVSGLVAVPGPPVRTQSAAARSAEKRNVLAARLKRSRLDDALPELKRGHGRESIEHSRFR